MKRSFSILIVLLLCTGHVALAQDSSAPSSLEELQGNGEGAPREVTLLMRVKLHDPLFQRLVFYDSNNHDIEFDISSKELRRQLGDSLLNMHPGVMCRVTFRVTGRGTSGRISGTLVSAVPEVLYKQP